MKGCELWLESGELGKGADTGGQGDEQPEGVRGGSLYLKQKIPYRTERRTITPPLGERCVRVVRAKPMICAEYMTSIKHQSEMAARRMGFRAGKAGQGTSANNQGTGRFQLSEAVGNFRPTGISENKSDTKYIEHIGTWSSTSEAHPDQKALLNIMYLLVPANPTPSGSSSSAVPPRLHPRSPPLLLMMLALHPPEALELPVDGRHAQRVPP